LRNAIVPDIFFMIFFTSYYQKRTKNLFAELPLCDSFRRPTGKCGVSRPEEPEGGLRRRGAKKIWAQIS
jgi:hypothetical protein